MAYTLAGLILWTFAHLFQFLFPNQRKKMGVPFKGVVALSNLAALGLFVIGWQNTNPSYFYSPTGLVRQSLIVLSSIGIALFIVSLFKSRVKQYIRHPQLLGFMLWCVAHLGLNGDSRSLILFSGLFLWAVMEVLFINARDGAWSKPKEVQPLGMEALMLGAIAVALSVLFQFHHILSGITIS